MRLPLHRFCNAVYMWMLERVEDRALFEYHLTKPIPGMVVTEGDARSEMDEFAAIQSAFGGGR